MAKVKICGLTEPDTLRVAVREGADWVGFVLVPQSPRYVTPEDAAALVALAGPAIPVALLVNPDDAAIDAACETGVAVLQLHGAESPERVADIRARSGLQVWKALGIGGPEDLARAAGYSAADALLLDALPPHNATRTGGHGQSFDWSLLARWEAPGDWLLAGGLTPDNVAAAIAATGATAVDVSSGVEHVRGVKNAALVRDFIRAARSA